MAVANRTVPMQARDGHREGSRAANQAGRQSSKHEDGHCPWLLEVLSRVGDTWTILLVVTLADGPMRYNQLRKQIGTISQRMLTLTLKRLEQDGLVDRTVYASVPPRVDYELTELGRGLKESLAPLHDWALQNREAVAEARERFGRAAGVRAVGEAAGAAGITLN